MKKLPLETRKALESFLIDCPPSSERAQIINILSYRLDDDQTIADRFIQDHVSREHAYRQAMILVRAGCAKKEEITKNVHCGNGVFKEKVVAVPITFEDGSTI